MLKARPGDASQSECWGRSPHFNPTLLATRGNMTIETEIISKKYSGDSNIRYRSRGSGCQAQDCDAAGATPRARAVCGSTRKHLRRLGPFRSRGQNPQLNVETTFRDLGGLTSNARPIESLVRPVSKILARSRPNRAYDHGSFREASTSRGAIPGPTSIT